MGDTPQLRILDFLIDNPFFDHPLTEIAREAEVSYNSLKSIFPSLINSEIVMKTRKVGKSDYYKLNQENKFVKNLMKLDWSLSKQSVLPSIGNPESSMKKVFDKFE